MTRAKLLVLVLGLLVLVAAACFPRPRQEPIARELPHKRIAPPDVTLPRSTSRLPIDPRAFAIVLSPTELRLLDGTVLCRMASPGMGFDGTCKRGGAQDLYLSPLGHALMAPEAGADGAVGIIVYAAAATSFRAVLEVSHTVLLSMEASSLSFAVTDGVEEHRVRIDLPKARSAFVRPDADRPWDPVVAIRVMPEGFDAEVSDGEVPQTQRQMLAAFGRDAASDPPPPGTGHVATGCRDFGSGTTVPVRQGASDYAALRDCAVWLRARGLSRASVNLVGKEPLQTVISVVDAIGEAGGDSGPWAFELGGSSGLE